MTIQVNTPVDLSVIQMNSLWRDINFGDADMQPRATPGQMGLMGIDTELFRARDRVVELSIAGNKSNLLNYSKNGKTETKSNFLISKCYNNCSVLHPFNPSKRNECKAQCDKDAAAEQKQQDELKDVINAPSAGISNGVIWGIVIGIVGLTVGGALLIRKMKKKKSA